MIAYGVWWISSAAQYSWLRCSMLINCNTWLFFLIAMETKIIWKTCPKRRIEEIVGSELADNKFVWLADLSECFWLDWTLPPILAIIEFAKGYNYREQSVHFRGTVHPFTPNIVWAAFKLPIGGVIDSTTDNNFHSRVFGPRTAGNLYTIDKLLPQYATWRKVIRLI